LRAVAVWGVVLATVILPRLTPATPPATAAVTQLSAYDRQSVLRLSQAAKAQAAQDAQVQAWSNQLKQGLADYQHQLQVQRAAQAEAARIAALSNHAPPPANIAKIIYDAFSPLGPRAVQWAINVAYCESRYHPNSVNSDSGAAGLFQFMPSTWGGTPWAKKSPFDPVANAQAAAWLYSRPYGGPGRWTCQG
jgi:hypothetical protein